MLRIYNTLTRRKEDFQTLEPGKVKMYVCGVTVYDHCHIGHARSAIVFDTIYRYLRSKGFDVTYVRNFTDIDDKIIKRAHEQNVSALEIAEKYTQIYFEQMQSLGIELPDVSPHQK